MHPQRRMTQYAISYYQCQYYRMNVLSLCTLGWVRAWSLPSTTTVYYPTTSEVSAVLKQATSKRWSADKNRVNSKVDNSFGTTFWKQITQYQEATLIRRYSRVIPCWEAIIAMFCEEISVKDIWSQAGHSKNCKQLEVFVNWSEVHVPTTRLA